MISAVTDRAAWLEARRGYVTASDIAALLGESKYKTRYQLLLEKAGIEEDSFQGNEQTELGNYLEPAIADAAAGKFGWKLERSQRFHVDQACANHGATPDYFVDTPWGRGIVQIKLTTAQAHEDCKPRKNGEPSTAAYANGAPLYHLLQVQSELACTGLEWGTLLVLHATAPTFKLRAYPVPRHEGVIAKIRAEVTSFMAELAELKALGKVG